jgi:hypothetical protein
MMSNPSKEPQPVKTSFRLVPNLEPVYIPLLIVVTSQQSTYTFFRFKWIFIYKNYIIYRKKNI